MSETVASKADGHRVLKKIDRAKPYFTRDITRHLDGKTTQHLLEIWLPVEAEHGGWLSAVTIDGLGLPEMSAMPGDDRLGALISALQFVRTLFDEKQGKFTFEGWNYGKLPANIDYQLS
jgi:hypothetical protein